ncbi:hypothetical protein [Bacillus sp. Au-Bac7]|uniref:hypothetical protein n=1 Tax=Bacillus sp. Au-Bac7 TaxID=2906458 RepID=UPI001E48A606|nr:hypothetical protein [Bacillus sp. Au-Bac7]MCE4051890.1 hypothetical protein [Bacillus sp. Au-Bac7]
MPKQKVIITKENSLNGQVAEVVSDYINEEWEQKYVLRTKDHTKVTVKEDEIKPLLRRVK